MFKNGCGKRSSLLPYSNNQGRKKLCRPCPRRRRRRRRRRRTRISPQFVKSQKLEPISPKKVDLEIFLSFFLTNLFSR
jgi:hypothetical protein